MVASESHYGSFFASASNNFQNESASGLCPSPPPQTPPQCGAPDCECTCCFPSGEKDTIGRGERAAKCTESTASVFRTKLLANSYDYELVSALGAPGEGEDACSVDACAFYFDSCPDRSSLRSGGRIEPRYLGGCSPPPPRPRAPPPPPSAPPPPPTPWLEDNPDMFILIMALIAAVVLSLLIYGCHRRHQRAQQVALEQQIARARKALTEYEAQVADAVASLPTHVHRAGHAVGAGPSHGPDAGPAEPDKATAASTSATITATTTAATTAAAAKGRPPFTGWVPQALSVAAHPLECECDSERVNEMQESSAAAATVAPQVELEAGATGWIALGSTHLGSTALGSAATSAHGPAAAYGPQGALEPAAHSETGSAGTERSTLEQIGDWLVGMVSPKGEANMAEVGAAEAAHPAQAEAAQAEAEGESPEVKGKEAETEEWAEAEAEAEEAEAEERAEAGVAAAGGSSGMVGETAGLTAGTVLPLGAAEAAERARAGDGAGGRGDEAMYAPECAICLSEFDDGDMVRVLPCNHGFHKECADEWLLGKGRQPARSPLDARRLPTCPLCKAVPIRIADFNAAAIEQSHRSQQQQQRWRWVFHRGRSRLAVAPRNGAGPEQDGAEMT